MARFHVAAGTIRSTIAACATLALVLPLIAPALAATNFTRADYEACQTRDERELRQTIKQLSAAAFKAGTKSIDYVTLVRGQWIRNDLDAIIDKRVDKAIEDVRNETSWSERIKSLANAEISQKLAANVAERVYRNDAVTAAIEALATGVAADVGKTIEFTGADAAQPLLECLQAFVGPQYGSAVARAVAGDARQQIEAGTEQGASSVSSGAVLKQSTGGLTGATILIVRRQLGQLAARIGQRIAGSVLSRLVSVVAGGVGLVLIGKDIWELRNGVLPIIASEMKADATKDKVRAEIAGTLSEQVSTHVDEIAVATSDHLMDVWQGFKQAHALVLRLSETNGEFRGFMDTVTPDKLVRLDEVVALLVASEGDKGVAQRLANGTLNHAVNVMPAEAMEIARDTKSVAQALDWTSLAGERLKDVVDYGLHRRATPQGFTRASFATLMALGDRSSILRLASIDGKARDILFQLPVTDVSTLARALPEEELTALAHYLSDLAPAPRDRILRDIAADPSRMKIIASPTVRAAIIASRDQAAAAEMMLGGGDGPVTRGFAHDVTLVWNERVNPWLLWSKHPVAVSACGALFLLVMIWLGRLFRPRRTA